MTIDSAPAHVDDIDWPHWQPTEKATLLFVRRDDDILLIRKKRGLGAGKINGPGGRLEPGETPLDCAVRETREELHITALAPQLCGRQRFHFVDGYKLTVFVFLSNEFEGTPQETEEAIPLWSSIDTIPYAEMWEDDALWIPMMLRGEAFDGRYIFDGDRMLSYRFRDPADLDAIAADDPSI